MWVAALDIITEELLTNTGKLRKIPGLYESFPRFHPEISP